MRKLAGIILILLVIFTSGCSSAVIPNEGSITLTLDDDFRNYVNLEKIPDFTFEFDGTLNTQKFVSKSYYTVFTNNDDIILSDALDKVFKYYEEKNQIIYDVVNTQEVNSTLFSKLNKYGKVENLELEPDDKQVIDETAYISLDNGLKLTVDYRRFLYNGKMYYTWRYSASITMYLYYPLMLVKKNDKPSILLITLPNTVTFQVGPSLRLSNLINSKTYYQDEVDDGRYTFDYPLYSYNRTKEKIKLSFEEGKEKTIAYYVDEIGGVYDEANDEITYTYLGNKFKVKLLEKNFKMYYIGKE